MVQCSINGMRTQAGERIRRIYGPPLDKAGVLCYHIKAEMFSAHANMAQVVEQLTRNEQVEGSSPSIGSHAAR